MARSISSMVFSSFCCHTSSMRPMKTKRPASAMYKIVPSLLATARMLDMPRLTTFSISGIFASGTDAMSFSSTFLTFASDVVTFFPSSGTTAFLASGYCSSMAATRALKRSSDEFWDASSACALQPTIPIRAAANAVRFVNLSMMFRVKMKSKKKGDSLLFRAIPLLVPSRTIS